ncbi:MAG: GGDEF domain-containing phosphodiesterase [Acetatifactor sp.]|nr:GGDEF domain-containing phosphodiesterase [Acetatifactor sp.]
MEKQDHQMDVVDNSKQNTEAGKQELYLYSLRKMAEDNVEKNKSPLTQLQNLRSFFYMGGEIIRENPQEQFALIAMDIAQFKAVNEFCGRDAGDALLATIAEIFRELDAERPLTISSHARADVFAMLTTYQEEQELIDIVLRIKKVIDDFPIDCKVLPAFGIATSQGEPPAISYLKDCATMALNTIKGKFYASYAFFDEKMRRQQMMEKKIENNIVTALKNGEFALYIQPKVDMATGQIIGGEALVRWVDPNYGVISPGDFLPVLEKNGFVIDLDTYIWEQVFQMQSRLLSEGRKPVPVSVNVSRVHAFDECFCDTLCRLSEQYQVEPSYVPLELTESAFLWDEQGMYQRLETLQSKGFIASMDDFGTGYSTMNMLKNQSMDEVKVDQTFIRDLETNEKSRIMIRHTIRMLQELDTDIIVEGVETEEQRKFLLDCGCKAAQGYLFYRPMPWQDFVALL